MRLALAILSVLAFVSLVVAQLGAYLDFELVPQPTAAATGPQGPQDLLFGLLALGGGILGFLLSIAAGIVGLIVASAGRHQLWLVAIIGCGALVIVGLAVSAFVLLGLPRNPYHPLMVFVVVPVTLIAFLIATAGRARGT